MWCSSICWLRLIMHTLRKPRHQWWTLLTTLDQDTGEFEIFCFWNTKGTNLFSLHINGLFLAIRIRKGHVGINSLFYYSIFFPFYFYEILIFVKLRKLRTSFLENLVIIYSLALHVLARAMHSVVVLVVCCVNVETEGRRRFWQ